jgi:DNA-binding transcriptional LysR family regulator
MKHQLRDIEYFSVVAEHGNLGRAAEALGLSQPALSKSLRRLEISMEAKLVKRTFKGVELTAVGAALFSHVRRLRFALDDVTREVADLTHGRTGHLRVGTSPGLAIYLVPAACATLLKGAPRVTFKVTVLDRETALSALRHGELDFTLHALQPSRREDLAEEYLCEEEFVVYASTGHRLATKQQVTLADLARERWAVNASSAVPVQRLRQSFLDAGLPPPEIAVETNALPLRLELLASSDLVGVTAKSLVREAAARSGLVQIPIKGWTYTRRAGVMYRKDAYLSPAAKRFIEILKATAKEIAKKQS